MLAQRYQGDIFTSPLNTSLLRFDIVFTCCRYYNSWIETSEETAASDTSTSQIDTSSSEPPADKSASSRLTPSVSVHMRNSLGLRDDFENLVPAEVLKYFDYCTMNFLWNG